MRKLLVLVSAIGLVAVGCMNAETHATADQEKLFRHPNTTIPPDIQVKMQAARERAAKGIASQMNGSNATAGTGSVPTVSR